jgi:hypothetical protein
MAWAPSYASSADLKAYLRVADAVDDAQVSLALDAASRAIDLACGRQFGQVAAPSARYFTASYDRRAYRWRVAIDDVATITGLAVAFDSAGDGSYASTITAYDLGPRNAVDTGRVWTELVVRQTSTVLPTDEVDGVKITAAWGWSAVPDTIKMATLLQASRVLARRSSPLGISGSPDMGGEMRLLAKLDPDVEAMLRPYRRWWFVAEPTHGYGYGPHFRLPGWGSW